jgi:hypothetical protein
MSHMPHDVPTTVEADFQTTPFIGQERHSETAAPAMTSSYIPLAQRTSDQLRANADELRRMAATATTEDIMRALLTLANRYAALAAERRDPPQQTAQQSAR